MSGEVYNGVKFRTIFISRKPPQDPRLDELAGWTHRLAGLGVLATAMGNLSIRTPSGLIITPTGTDPATLTPEQFVEVLTVNMATRAITARGCAEPSSESMMHAAIYGARPDVKAIFHGHDARVLAATGLPVTAKEQPYGTPALVEAVLTMAGKHDLFVMRNHGFVSVASSMELAGRRIEELLQKL